MTAQNGLTGWLRSVFGSDSDEDNEAGDDDVVVEFETVDGRIPHEFSTELTRTVELIHFTSGGTLLVEHDWYRQQGQERTYSTVTGYTEDGVNKRKTNTVTMSYNNVITSVNDTAVAHRQPLGELTVSVTQQATLTCKYERVMNMDDLPDRVLDDEGLPSTTNDLVYENGKEIKVVHDWSRNKRDFEHFEGDVAFDRRYCVDELSEPEIEVDGNMMDLLTESVVGHTDQMSAITADGQIMLAGDDASTADMVSMNALPGDGE